jgi:hypothetical protein
MGLESVRANFWVNRTCQHMPSFLSPVRRCAGSLARYAAVCVAAPASCNIGTVKVSDPHSEVISSSNRRSAVALHVPTASNERPVQAALGGKADLHVVTGAGHFSFLVPCGLIGPPFLCRDDKGFDRELFHKSFNREVRSGSFRPGSIELRADESMGLDRPPINRTPVDGLKAEHL